MAVHPIHVKRVYQPAANSDGCRILVDGIWPRGVRKEALAADLWLKEVAPSRALRQWFGHDAAKWAEFKARYYRELEDRQPALEQIRQRQRHGPVTLLFAARDEQHNQAVALKSLLDEDTVSG